tara:strand:+ start:3870 stop:4019 length:150 start_codon:yes stop_codon:yes gene_type:complete
MDDSNYDDLSIDEKMLIYMIREFKLPLRNIFTSIYNAYDIANLSKPEEE